MSFLRQKGLRRYHAKPFYCYWAVSVVFVIAIALTGCTTVVASKPHRQLCFSSSRSVNARNGRDCTSMTPKLCRRPSSQYLHYQCESVEAEKEYFVSDAQFVHLSPAARILTEEFYSHKTNFITFQLERLKTVLSLESTFPNKQNSMRIEYSGRSLQRMIVACNAKNGEVIGFAEIDARSLRNSNVADASSGDGASNDVLRSYMYNLAVDKKWKRKGIASALVKACEKFVTDMHDSCIEKRLYLRVRKSNHAAVALYEKLGYREMNPEIISLNKEDVNSGSLEDGELILFAKDLPVGAECMLN